jgi:hypothetical protein
MEFKVGDIVYTDDTMVIQNCGGIHKYPAVIWKIDDDIIGLRYFNFTYEGSQFHGTEAKYLRHVPALIKELI